MLVSAVLDFYLRHHIDRKPAHLRWRPTHSVEILRRGFAGIELHHLTPPVVHAFLDRRAEGRIAGAQKANSTGTLRYDITILNAAQRFAAKSRLITLAEMMLVDLPDRSPPRERFLSSEEIETLLRVAAEGRRRGRLSRVERFVWIALETGARRHAVETLSWRQVDMVSRTIDFRDPSAPPSKKRRAKVPISDRLYPILERAQSERGKFEHVLDRPTDIHTSLEGLFQRAGLHGVSAHTLRHTFASHAVMAGVSLYDVASILGNSYQVVESTYAHLSPDHLRSAVNFARTR